MNITLKIFPNPTRDVTQIRFYLPEVNDINLTIFDINGKLMRQIQLAQAKGWQEMELDAVNLPSGIYWLRLQTKEEILTRKFSIVKE